MSAASSPLSKMMLNLTPLSSVTMTPACFSHRSKYPYFLMIIAPTRGRQWLAGIPDKNVAISLCKAPG
jgi:hypothetical protein